MNNSNFNLTINLQSNMFSAKLASYYINKDNKIKEIEA